MFLLKLHFSISILCFLFILGCFLIFKTRLMRYKEPKKKVAQCKRIFRTAVISVIPIFNLITCFLLVYMAACDDETANKIMNGGEISE